MKKHGKSNSPEYIAWQNMIKRCYSPKEKSYSIYGGRGIGVYEDWRHSFASFYKHIGDRPTKKHSLDRIDNDKDYAPGNVRWANKTVQGFNRGNFKNNTLGFKGIAYHKKNRKFVAQTSHNGKMRYLGSYDTPEEASAAYQEYVIKRLQEELGSI